MEPFLEVCVCYVCGALTMTGEAGAAERLFVVAFAVPQILINLILLYDTETILLAENMTVLYGCNKKSQP